MRYTNNSYVCMYVRYDTIRYSRLTCAQKLTSWPA